jgi:hypothetical protein
MFNIKEALEYLHEIFIRTFLLMNNHPLTIIWVHRHIWSYVKGKPPLPLRKDVSISKMGSNRIGKPKTRVTPLAKMMSDSTSVDVTWHGISRILAYATDFQ